MAEISELRKAGNTIYISGKIGFTKEGKLAEGGLAGEVHQAMKNFGATLEAAGCTFDNGTFLWYLLTFIFMYHLNSCVIFEISGLLILPNLLLPAAVNSCF